MNINWHETSSEGYEGQARDWTVTVKQRPTGDWHWSPVAHEGVVGYGRLYPGGLEDSAEEAMEAAEAWLPG